MRKVIDLAALLVFTLAVSIVVALVWVGSKLGLRDERTPYEKAWDGDISWTDAVEQGEERYYTNRD